MKRTLIATAGFALFAASGLARAASWSVFVEPGVYGRVAIGGYAEPPVVYAPQPVIAVDNGYGQVVEEEVDPAYATNQPPVYLWVPEYQRLHWAQYCRDYGAVGVPVYFVDDGWYRANVLRRNWTPEQRSWSQQQWLEHDRVARDRYERRRFEQQRYEQQQRWNAQREWYSQQQQQARWNHDNDNDRGQRDGQNRIRWGSAQGFLPSQANPGTPAQAQPGGGQWQQGGGQWQRQGNGGRPVGGAAGNGGYAGTGGYPGNGGYAGNAGQQPPTASQPNGGRAWQGGAGQNAAERRGDDRGQERAQERGDREERRGTPERHGGEHGRGGRDR